MTPSVGPDEMRNIMLSILDVRDLMEALFACQLLVTEEREHILPVMLMLMIKSHIKHVFFRAKAGKYNVMISS